MLAVGNDRQFASLCDLLDHPEWAQDAIMEAFRIGRWQITGQVQNVSAWPISDYGKVKGIAMLEDGAHKVC